MRSVNQRRVLVPLLFATALAGVLSATQNANDEEGDPGVRALAGEVEKLRADLAETRALLDETVEYLHQRAKDGEALSRVVDSSEQAGFTFGINPRSREVLIQGWRNDLTALQKGLPGEKVEEDGAPADTRTRRTFGG